jgi:hypothetical protein
MHTGHVLVAIDIARRELNFTVKQALDCPDATMGATAARVRLAALIEQLDCLENDIRAVWRVSDEA